MYCAKQQSMFGRLFTMDCQEHALEHCVIGLFEWMNQSFRSLSLRSARALGFGVCFSRPLDFKLDSVFHAVTRSGYKTGDQTSQNIRFVNKLQIMVIL